MVGILGFAGHLVSMKNYLALLWNQEGSPRQPTRKRRSAAVVRLDSVYKNRQLAAPAGHSLPTPLLDYRALILDFEFWKTQPDNMLFKGMILWEKCDE